MSSVAPGEPVPLATRAYWDDWYASKLAEEDAGDTPALEFEWLAGVGGEDEHGDEDASDGDALWSVIDATPRSSRVLELGCGVSRLAERMCDAGFERVDAIDFSDAPIAIMRARATSRRGSKYALSSSFDEKKKASPSYAVADARELDASIYPARSYDLITDKGLLDVLLNAHDQERWHERLRVGDNKSIHRCRYDGVASRADANKALRNVSRLLKPNGLFAVLSYEPPQGRSAFFEAPELQFRCRSGYPIEDGKGNTLFVLEKKAEDFAGKDVDAASFSEPNADDST